MAALTAIAQAENESMSEAIKWGIRRGMESESSKLCSRKFFGYKHDERGMLVSEDGQAKVVR